MWSTRGKEKHLLCCRVFERDTRWRNGRKREEELLSRKRLRHKENKALHSVSSIRIHAARTSPRGGSARTSAADVYDHTKNDFHFRGKGSCSPSKEERYDRKTGRYKAQIRDEWFS